MFPGDDVSAPVLSCNAEKRCRLHFYRRKMIGGDVRGRFFRAAVSDGRSRQRVAVNMRLSGGKLPSGRPVRDRRTSLHGSNDLLSDRFKEWCKNIPLTHHFRRPKNQFRASQIFREIVTPLTQGEVPGKLSVTDRTNTVHD